MSQIVEAKPESVGLSSQRLARIKPWMERYIADGKLPGALVAIARRGRTVYCDRAGLMNVEAKKPMAEDTIFRIYSMTKPITSTAIMMLYEEGRFQLDDSISRYLPMFKEMRVFAGGTAEKYDTVPAKGPITFKQLLTHTSGLTYGFTGTAVSPIYQAAQVADFQTAEATLPQMMERLAKLPLLAQPGAEWNYSVATDVLGALVETISGMPFDKFLRERIFEPLGMKDTDFFVHAGQEGRLAANYEKGAQGGMTLIDDPRTSRYLKPRKLCSGGGGLASTAHDYMRFCKMLARKGELDGVRLLGRKTVEYMMLNHLDGRDMAAMGMPRFSESNYDGVGFGLGGSVVIDPAKAQVLRSAGEFAWGGAASTAFWIDPQEDLIAVFMTQLMPSSSYPLRSELRVLTYQALVD